MIVITKKKGNRKWSPIDLDTQSIAGSDVADDQVKAAETQADVIGATCFLQVYYIINDTCWDRS